MAEPPKQPNRLSLKTYLDLGPVIIFSSPISWLEKSIRAPHGQPPQPAIMWATGIIYCNNACSLHRTI